VIILLLLIFIAFPSWAEAEEQFLEGLEEEIIAKEEYNGQAEFIILNKITTKVETKTIRGKTPLVLKKLAIYLENCQSTRDGDQALIKIFDTNVEKHLLYHGILFNNSPSKNLFLHPVYDLTLIRCIND